MSGHRASRRRCGALALLAALAAVAAFAPAAGAAEPVDRLEDLPCQTYPSQGGDQEICSGQVRSFDGSPLDVDLTKPLNDHGAKDHPLMVMLHGFGNNKHEWESLRDEGEEADKFHWNSHWFAKRGYYVLTYTARGFCRDDNARAGQCDATRADQPDTPSFASAQLPSGTIQLKSREAEIRDTQYLSALTAGGFADVDTERVAVTGGSYGGGESWVQASQAAWTFPNRCTQPAEADRPPECRAAANPDGPSFAEPLPVLDLQVAVPKYPWTDLGYSLAPNGHPRACPAGATEEGDDPLYESAQGCSNSDTGDGNPIGTLKASFVGGFFAIGNARGIFEQGTRTPPTQGDEGPINITNWNARAAVQGDPYDVAGAEDDTIRQVRRGLTEFRSAYYQDEGWEAQRDGRKVAIFAMQGWTDDLFPAVEATRQFKYLKRLDPRWPVEVELADIGHARGQNKPRTWQRLNAQAFQFLNAHIGGSHEQETTVSSQPTICANDGEPDERDVAAQRLTAQTPEGLANGMLAVEYARGGATSAAADAADPNGPPTDPAFGGLVEPVFGGTGPCRESPGPAPSYTAFSEPLRSHRTYVGLGSVRVPQYVLAGATTATLHARVWDDPPGSAPSILMTRGTYRIDTPAYDGLTGTLDLPLFGNHWPLRPGHRIRLDLTQVDQPFLRPSNLVTGTVAFGPPTLRLPTRESAETVVPGS